MTPKRWKEIDELMQAALERTPKDRRTFLDQACGNDDTLRREVESLISFESRASAFLEHPAFQASSEASAEAAGYPEAETQIGPYRLIREIGRGGMGAVYLALRSDDQYQKRVAIKVIKRGMDTDFIVRRFRQERQILAALDHPNIARLHDGGATPEGLPYFVMEYVDGKAIDAYCDTRSLSVKDRLELFRAVCSAAQYAHQNLVVHRDIKPGNILVNEQGVPKLLDFGLAKLLNPELYPQTIDPTATALRLMTPRYASPEQARGGPITTATDVYSLGIVLYELLTGHRPYNFTSESPPEVFRVICEQEPVKPSSAVSRAARKITAEAYAETAITSESTSKNREGHPDKLRRRLAGDLDNIVMKAISKEAHRRYQSVEQFSEDIRRHLVGLPVIARKDTISYRTAKFIKRHKIGVLAAALIVLALLGATWQAFAAHAERARAERRFNDVRKLANSFMFEIHDGIRDLPGSTATRELLVKTALQYLDSLAQEASGDTSLQRELANAYGKVGAIQGQEGSSGSLGDSRGASESYQKEARIREALCGANPDNVDDRRELAKVYDRLCWLYLQTGRRSEAIPYGRKALELLEALLAGDPTNDWVRYDLANTFELAGTVETDLDASLDYVRKASEIYQGLLAKYPARAADNRRNLSRTYKMIGARLNERGESDGALEHYSRALAIEESLVSANPDNAVFQRDIGVTHSDIGWIHETKDDWAAALVSHRKALAIRASLVEADPKNADARRALASTLANIGRALRAIGDHRGALDHLRRALAIREALSAADPLNRATRQTVADTLEDIGRVLHNMGDYKSALETHRKAFSIREPLFAADVSDQSAQYSIASSYHNIGGSLLDLGDTNVGLEYYHKAATIYEQLLGSNPADTSTSRDLASLLRFRGDVQLKMALKASAGMREQTLREARASYQRSLQLWLDMQSRGILSKAEQTRPDELSRQIAECDAALSKLAVTR